MAQNQFDSQREKIDPNQAINTIGSLAGQLLGLLKSKDDNETERERIRADKEKTLAQIEATREVLMTFLNRSFDERAIVLKKSFEVMDVAIKNNDIQALACTVQSVTSLAAQSPFTALLDVRNVRNSLMSSDAIEI